jgi:hypothetical protein
LRALKSNDLYFILAKVEAGAGEVPAAALDSQENKYLFVRYIEKSENLIQTRVSYRQLVRWRPTLVNDCGNCISFLSNQDPRLFGFGVQGNFCSVTIDCVMSVPRLL